MIKTETIDRIFETARIEEVVGDFVELKRSGAVHKGNCPFHQEKTPSFVVSPAKGIFKCFGCGKGGNAVGFIMDHQHKTYPEALKYLADKYNILIEEEKPDPERKKKQDLNEQLIKFNEFALQYYQWEIYQQENALLLEYAKSRFTNETISTFKIGAAPDQYNGLAKVAREKGYKEEFLLKTGLIRQSEKTQQLYDFFRNRIIFPVHDRHGRIISFSGRVLPGADKRYGKYINGVDTPIYKKSNVLYGLHLALTPIIKSKTAVLVEGNPDAIRLHEIGISNVVAPLGTALTAGQINLLNRFAEKIILLYDGDNAGSKALIKSGKLLVEKGMIPYAATLPEGEDPDTFFKSEKHFNKWIEENKKDFIGMFANQLLSKVGEDPALKNDAINEISNLLIHLDKTSRELYIDKIGKKSKLKAKLFGDKLKELELEKHADDKPKTFVPDGVDANDFEKWGFYEYKHAYFFRNKNGIEKLSNFIMKPVFHIDSIIDSKRIYELFNEHGYRVVVNLDMNEMTSLQGFQRNVESKGNFMFWGQMAQFQKMKLKLYEETRTCVEVKNLGWQREGFWAWANGMIDPNGNFVEIDEYGIVSHNVQDYFIPAFSKIYLKDKSIFLDERKFQYRTSEVNLEKWMKLYLKVHGNNAMVAFSWYIAALFRDHILYLNDNFPLLNLFGQKGSGKNTIAYSLLSLFGKKQTEFNIHNGTKPGLAKHLEMFRNAIAFVDEYKNSLDFDKIETLKSIYNAIGRSRLNMDKGGKKEITEVNQAVIVAGQEMPTIDVALSSRMLFLQFLSKEGLSPGAKKDFEHLQEMERDGLPHITAMFLMHRKYFIEYFKENYETVMRKLVEATAKEEINDRLLRNICTVMSAFKTLEPKFNFGFNFDQLFQSGLEITRRHNRQIKQSDEIGVFWNLLEAMFDDDILVDGWHFKVKMMTRLKTKQSEKSWPEGKRILRFKFNSIAKLYSEQLRRRNEKALPQDSLMHYLQTNKHFIGIERACKFIRKDYQSGEGKIIEQKQTTTAFCFDYDKLNINLEREAIEAYNGPVNGQSVADLHSEPALAKAEDDELPF